MREKGVLIVSSNYDTKGIKNFAIFLKILYIICNKLL